MSIQIILWLYIIYGEDIQIITWSILECLPTTSILQTYHQIMRLMYEIILATDLAHHLSSLKAIRNMIKSY